MLYEDGPIWRIELASPIWLVLLGHTVRTFMEWRILRRYDSAAGQRTSRE
jgi:hypothetical protein